MIRLPATARYAGALLAGAVLCACAFTQLQPDRNARAPAIEGFGATTMSISSASPEARRLFAQGMTQAHGFNDAEAVRAFKAALAQDPACAMCAWGVAWQLGPNINRERNDQVAEAQRYVDYARRHAAGATPLERSLIEALVQRYAKGAEASRIVAEMAPVCATGRAGAIHPLDMAYAVSMRALADAHPGNPDVQTLYAEAEMIATPVPWWDPATGKPSGRIGEVAVRVEQAMQAHPRHVGLSHYMIHAVDTGSQAARAVAAADQLGELAPGSPHLLHMPSHIFAHVGRYADAAQVNERALAAEDAFDARLAAQKFEKLNNWRGHNADFMMFGLLMTGKGDATLAMARTDAGRATGKNDYHEYRRSRPLFTMVRLGRWKDILAEPLPPEKKGVASIASLYARGMALARTGDTAGAQLVLKQLTPQVDEMVKAHTTDNFFDRLLRSLAQVMGGELTAEVATVEGRTDDALAHLAAVGKASETLESFEPPILAGSTRQALGDLQLKLKQWKDAEATFRRDLVRHPNSGWALRGLAAALQGQGRRQEAAQAEADMAKAWSGADAVLLASR